MCWTRARARPELGLTTSAKNARARLVDLSPSVFPARPHKSSQPIYTHNSVVIHPWRFERGAGGTTRSRLGGEAITRVTRSRVVNCIVACAFRARTAPATHTATIQTDYKYGFGIILCVCVCVMGL